MKLGGILAAVALALFACSVTLPASQKPESSPLAPGFTLRDQVGAPVRLADYRGRVVLMNFWATWCGDCNVEVPWFSAFQSQYGPRGLTVLGVSLDELWTPVV